MTSDLATETPCCDHPHIINVDGQWTCMTCGGVRGYELNINTQGTRYYTAEEASKRCIHAPVPFTSGSRTVFNAYENMKSGDIQKYRRLAKINRSSDWRDHATCTVAAYIRDRKAQLHFTDAVTSDSLRIFKIAMSFKLARGRNLHMLADACLYFASRLNKDPISVKSLFKTYETTNALRLIALVKTHALPQLGVSITSNTTADQYIIRCGNELQLPSNTLQYALKLVAILTKSQFIMSGKDPKGIAAAALYLASIATRHKVSQKTIATTIGITEVTLRIRAQNIRNIVIRLPPQIYDTINPTAIYASTLAKP